MAYGVKQLEQYSFYSNIQIKETHFYYSLGLLDAFPGTVNSSPRYFNYYGQAKWDSVKRLYGKLKAMGDYMYPPGVISNHLQQVKTVRVNSYQDYENAQHLPYSYLSNITSYFNNNGGRWDNPDILQQDPIEKRYFEIGFYNDPNDSRNKYMLVVNKRCVPVQNAAGDLRALKFYFTGLGDFNNRILKDVMTGDNITFVKKNTSGVYFPHIFQPGEGKLFKLSPA